MTGASTGIGAATARELARRGFRVLAGVRRDVDATTLRGPGIEPVMLDITVPDHIDSLRARVGTGLRALVNNAGIAVNAPVEALPLGEWRHQFEVNLFGHIAVTQALLPALLHDGGRVVNISSVGGRVALPTYGAYAGAKFALEAVSDALRRELAPHGVQVIVIEPGGVRTEMAGRGGLTANRLAEGMTSDQDRRYGGLVQAVVAQAAAFTASGLPAADAARVVARAVTDGRPRTRYTVGRDAAVLTRLARVLPDRVLDRVVAAGLRPHFPAAAGSPVAGRAWAWTGRRVRDQFAEIDASDPDAVLSGFLDLIRPVVVQAAGGTSCAVAAVTVEATPAQGALRGAAGEALRGWTGVLEARLRHVGVASAPARATAQLMIVFLEGSLIVARATGDVTAFEEGASALLRAARALCRPEPGDLD